MMFVLYKSKQGVKKLNICNGVKLPCLIHESLMLACKIIKSLKMFA